VQNIAQKTGSWCECTLTKQQQQHSAPSIEHTITGRFTGAKITVKLFCFPEKCQVKWKS
jgi:hypothetical protein